jgi:NAD(P)-dependent dehydrogenase (short-subunit alcohol dehydrogenase family)
VGPQIKNNLLSNIYTMNSFLHLIRSGAEKKMIFISSQSGNLDFTRITGFSTLLGYSVSKAGMNMAVTKFATELAPEGIKTLALSPGWVNTDAGKSLPMSLHRYRGLD